MLEPLQHTVMDVSVEPDDAYERDIVICDNADRDLAKEVLKKPFHNAALVYRMRGDVFHELDLWPIHWSKQWIAENIILPNVDGVVAVSDRLADKYRHETGLQAVGSAGLCKRVDEWPAVSHEGEELNIVTLTNMNYWEKIRPIVSWAEPVNAVLSEVGGHWRVCGEGNHDDRLADELASYSHVSYEGWVNADDVLQESNLMLHPSLLDGQPNSVLEGMASNLPVVTNDFEAFTEFPGPLCVASSAVELKDYLRTFTDPNERQNKGRDCREYIQTSHSPEAIAEQYELFCQNVLA
ncbi:glycosyltransferase [Halovivax asiaticus]|nr:glycosyltransferase [Halovivax asiaticus]